MLFRSCMNSQLEDLDRLARQAERYARYSRSAGGLSSVIGGGLLAASFLLNAYAELTPVLRALLAATPLFWLAAKELLRRRYYQREGALLQAPTTKERRAHAWNVVYLTVVSLLVLGFVAAALLRDSRAPDASVFGYVAMVVAIPFVAWRWFWSASDFLVGVLLMCQSAVVIHGGNYPPIWLPYIALCAAIAIFTGWREHRDYLALRAELEAPRGLRDTR